jgi:EpsI family protein
MKLPIRNFILLLVMLATAGLAIAMRPTYKNLEHRPKLDLEAMIPEVFEDWHVDKSIVPLAPSPDLQAVIESTYDQTLSRTYINSKNQRVMLSIAYSGDFSDKSIQYHRPEVCYPAQGFELLSKSSGVLSSPYGDIPVTRLNTKNLERREPVTYWVTASGLRASYGYSVRFIQLKAGLTGKIPDGLQVRFSSISGDTTAAYLLHDQFANSLLRSVSPDDAQKIAGKSAE